MVTADCHRSWRVYTLAMFWILLPLIASAALDRVAPLAERLGRGNAQSVVETGFRLLEPTSYHSVTPAGAQQADRARLDGLLSLTQSVAASLGIDASVSGRVKSAYSTHRKMQRKQLAFEEVHDRVAVRAIVPDVDGIYSLLDALTARLPTREVKDYVANPKDNGYQSVHQIIEMDGGLAEIQIRTAAMHAHAETGSAAHWRYKLAAA